VKRGVGSRFVEGLAQSLASMPRARAAARQAAFVVLDLAMMVAAPIPRPIRGNSKAVKMTRCAEQKKHHLFIDEAAHGGRAPRRGKGIGRIPTCSSPRWRRANPVHRAHHDSDDYRK